MEETCLLACWFAGCWHFFTGRWLPSTRFRVPLVLGGLTIYSSHQLYDRTTRLLPDSVSDCGRVFVVQQKLVSVYLIFVSHVCIVIARRAKCHKLTAVLRNAATCAASEDVLTRFHLEAAIHTESLKIRLLWRDRNFLPLGILLRYPHQISLQAVNCPKAVTVPRS
jgi:hypothetical protein